MPQGKVKWFSTEKAFGFIEQENDNDIFVHVTGLADGVTAIDKDQLVEYEVEQGRKGPQATNVRPATASAAPARASRPTSGPSTRGSRATASTSLAAMAWGCARTRGPPAAARPLPVCAWSVPGSLA